MPPTPDKALLLSEEHVREGIREQVRGLVACRATWGVIRQSVCRRMQTTAEKAGLSADEIGLRDGWLESELGQAEAEDQRKQDRDRETLDRFKAEFGTPTAAAAAPDRGNQQKQAAGAAWKAC
jgi:hypothetical protein